MPNLFQSEIGCILHIGIFKVGRVNPTYTSSLICTDVKPGHNNSGFFIANYRNKNPPFGKVT